MPGPNDILESWYVNLLKALNYDIHVTVVPSDPNGSRLLHTMTSDKKDAGLAGVGKVFDDDEPFALDSLLEKPNDPEAVKAQKRQKKEQIKKLAETGNLLIDTEEKKKAQEIKKIENQPIDPLSANPPAPQRHHAVIVTKPDGMPNIQPVDGEQFPDLSPLVADPQQLWKAAEMHNALAHLEKAGLNDVSKTITDLFPGSSFEEVLKNGWIVKPNGEPYEYKKENPYESFSKVIDASNSEEGVLIQDKPNQKAVNIKRQQDGQIKKTPRESLIMNPKQRKEVINQLELINGLLESLSDKKNPEFKEFKNACKQTLKNIKKTTYKKDIDKEVSDLCKLSDKYFIDNVGVKTNKIRANRMDVAYKLRNLKDCVQNDKLVSENKRDPIQSMKEVVGAKMVKAYATACANHSDDPEKQEYGKKLLSDPDAFNKKLAETMKDATFDYLYGGHNDASKARLRNALAEKSGSLLKTYAEEVKNPTPERKAHERYMQQTAQRPSRMQTYNKGPVSPQMRDELTQSISALNNKLQRIGGSATKSNSAEFNALKEELLVASIRLNSGAKYIDHREIMANLADKADAYFNSKIEGGMNGKGAERMDIASEIRDIQSNLDQNILPSQNKKGKNERGMENLANRMVRAAAERMQSDRNLEIQRRGKEMLNNPAKLQDQMNKLIKSEAFQSLYKNNPEQIAKDMEKNPADLFDKIVKTEAKLNPEKTTVKDNLVVDDDTSKMLKKQTEEKKMAASAFGMIK